MAYKQVVLVGGIVHRDGKILLLQRLESKRFFPGHWEIPGGKLDPGESPEEAVIREMGEETGLDATVASVYNTWADVVESNGNTEHIIEIDFILDVEDADSVTLSEKEHSSSRWVGEDEIPAPMTPQMRSTIETAFEHLRNGRDS